MSGQSAGGGFDAFLLCQRSGDREYRHDKRESPEPHGHRQQYIVERRVGREAGEGAAVVVRHGRQGVENLGESVCGGVEYTGPSPSVITAIAAPTSTRKGVTRITIEVIFISNDSIFLPMYSGVRPIINPATNTAMMANTSMP